MIFNYNIIFKMVSICQHIKKAENWVVPTKQCRFGNTDIKITNILPKEGIAIGTMMSEP